MKAVMQGLQSLGRALMLPIAVLPAAGLLLRLGQPDLLDVAFVAAAGDAIFANLGLLFAIGVATQLARDGNGAASLAAVVCYLVARNGAQPLMIVPGDITGDLGLTRFHHLAQLGHRQADDAEIEHDETYREPGDRPTSRLRARDGRGAPVQREKDP